jgi:hypothetical protein
LRCSDFGDERCFFHCDAGWFIMHQVSMQLGVEGHEQLIGMLQEHNA